MDALTRNPCERHVQHALVKAHMPLAQCIATEIWSGSAWSEIELNDIVQLGLIGLIETAEQFLPGRDGRFARFAHPRIVSTIFRGLQRYGLPQRAVQCELLRETVEAPSEERIAPENAAWGRFIERAPGSALASAADARIDRGDDDPCAPDNAHVRVELAQVHRQVAELIERLPESERRVILRHYLEQLSFDEIASELDLSKARVWQLHCSGLKRMRGHLGGLKSAYSLR